MKKRIIATSMVAAIFATQLCAFAAFTDLDSPRLEWAIKPIEEMTKMNIIKGYEDNTFRPDNDVSKAESLVLMSRINGFNEASSKPYREIAESTYESILKDYSTQYKNEISYLLYRKVLLPEDLPVYVGNSNASQPLKRYEAAILLTKLMGEEPNIKSHSSDLVTFDDANDIPSIAKPYVSFVVKNGIMQGMGENKFEPMYNVTRAQMATLLYRALSNLNYSYLEGTLSLYSYENDTVKLITSSDEIKTYTVRNSVPSALDGAYVSLSDFAVGSAIRITFSGNKVVFIEGTSPDYEDTIECMYESFERLTDGIVINVKDAKTSEKKKYTLSNNPTIIKNDKPVSITDLSVGDYLKIDILNGRAIYINAENKTKEITGVISNILLEPEYEINIDINGSEYSYNVYDNVSVRRNGKIVALADIMAGDSVTVTLNYNIISSIVATSSVSKKQGTLHEIRISNTPAIIVKSDGNTLTTYSVLRNVEIVRNGSVTDMYSLRVGDSITVTVEGSTVTKIELTSAASNSSITGKVEYANSAAGYIKLYDVPELIFINKAKVQDNAGKQLTARDIKQDVSITAFGTQLPGSVEATLIIIN